MAQTIGRDVEGEDEGFTAMPLSMPDVGDDADFERVRDLGRDVAL